ncbi:MAG: hypothetical protein AcusKO_09100 [Acuticoccus sp.]
MGRDISEVGDTRRTKAAKPATRAKKARSKRGRYTRAEADALFARLATALPEPRSELEYVNPYTLLVAVVLSAQATDAGVNRATRGLFAVADTPQKMLALARRRCATSSRPSASSTPRPRT